MATNWAKDGLDAYLALTGEKRAEDKAAADLKYQKDTMALSQNKDARDSAAAELTNQSTGMQIKKSRAELGESAKWDEWDGRLFETMVVKEAANPHSVTAATITDPAQVAASMHIYDGNLKTADFLRSLPKGLNRISIPVEQMDSLKEIPQYAKVSAMNILAPAAKKRGGQESTDPVTGKLGYMTGKLSHINLERDATGEWYISGDMEVINEDGSKRYAPFTDGTDNPNQPIKKAPLALIEQEAMDVKQGTAVALETGIDPGISISTVKYQRIKQLPVEMKKKLYEMMMRQEENLATRQSDVQRTKVNGKLMEKLTPQIDALDWKKDPHGSVMRLDTLLSQTGMTTAEKTAAVKEISAARNPKLDIREIGTSNGNAAMAIVNNDGTYKVVGGDYPKYPPKESRGGKSEKEMERDSRADIDKSVANFQQRRSAYNKARQSTITSGDPGQIKEMNAEYDNLQAESAEITRKYETHKKEFGRSYTPTAAPAAAGKGGGMTPPSSEPAPANPAKTKPPQKQANTPVSISADGKAATINGKTYPVANGIVTIEGKRYPLVKK